MALGWLWWRAWVPFGAVVAAAVCVAGVALGDAKFHFAWHEWHSVASMLLVEVRCCEKVARLCTTVLLVRCHLLPVAHVFAVALLLSPT